MELRKLPPDVVKRLRSGVAIVSIAHCTEELILNALDAGATAIAVRLHLTYHKVQVVDNGHGMSKKQLAACGERYLTSKCRYVADLEHPKFYGYRGEALASLAEMSGGLQIESRTAASETTYFKIFAQGKAHQPTRSLQNRPSVGTTVTVTDFMYNLPVRRRCVSASIDFEFCLQIMEGIALCHPHVSFTLRNDISGEICFQTHKTNSTLETFALMFGRSKATALKRATHGERKFNIKAYLSTEGHTSKQLQFVYLNDRLLLKTRIHKMINNVLKKYVFRNKNGLLPVSCTKNKHPVFIVFLKCTSRTYDITFEPKKTMVEFADWDAVTKSLECLLGAFLRQNQITDHNIVISGDLVFSQRSPEKAEDNVVSGKVVNQLRVEDFRNALLSKRVAGLRKPRTAEDIVGDNGGATRDGIESTCLPARRGLQSMDAEETVLPSEKGRSTELSGEQSGKLNFPRVPIALPPSYSSSFKKRGRLSLPEREKVLDITKFSFKRKQPAFAEQRKTKEKCAKVRQLQDTFLNKEVCSRTGIKSRRTHCPHESATEKMDDEHLQEDSMTFFQELKEEEGHKHSAIKKNLRAELGCYTDVSAKCVTFAEPSRYFASGANAHYSSSTKTSKYPQHVSTSSHKQPNEHQQDAPTYAPISRRLRCKFALCSASKNADCSPSGEIHHGESSVTYFHNEKLNFENSRALHLSNKSLEPFVQTARDVLCHHVEPNSRHEVFEGVPHKVLRLQNIALDNSSIETMEGLRVKDDDNESLHYEVSSVADRFDTIHDDSPCTLTTQPFPVTQEFNMPFYQGHGVAHEPLVTPPSSLIGREERTTPTRDTEILIQETTPLFHDDLPSVSKSVIPEAEYRAHSFGEGSASFIQCGQQTKDSFFTGRSVSLPLTTLTFLRSRDELPCRSQRSIPTSQHNHSLSNSSSRHLFQSHLSLSHAAEQTGSGMGSVSCASSQRDSVGEHFHETSLYPFDSNVFFFNEHDPAHLSRDNIIGDTTNEILKDAPSGTQPSNSMDDKDAMGQQTDSGRSEVEPPDIIRALKATAPDTEESMENCIKEPDLETSKIDPDSHKISQGWVAWEDPVSRQKMYFNLPSGNSSFQPPPCFGEQKAQIKSPCLDLELRTNIVPCGSSASLSSRPRVERPQFRCEPGPEQSSLMQLVQQWQNPVFTCDALQDIPDVGLYRQKNGVTASFSIRQPYRFVKEMLQHIKVIGQVDAKFIACLMPVYDNGMFKDDSLVVLFDQHAAHERVRLEQLLEGQYESFGSNRWIRSSSVDPSLELSVEPDVLRRVVICQKELNEVGIQFAMKKSAIQVERLPTCLVERDNSERQNGRSPTLSRHAKEILGEYTATLLATKKATIMLPKVMHDVLSSQACRGAIKFGSILGIVECQKILRGLATCNLPFQCAHGRPSLAPVVDLRYLSEKEDQEKPNLLKLRQAVSFIRASLPSTV